MTDDNFHDTDRAVRVQHQETVCSGIIWDIKRDTFTMHDGDESLTREYINHPGAVAVVAVDEHHRVALIRQYRHPVGQDCWEIPAGLLDAEQETLLSTAQRELAEETGLTAETWAVLIDHYPSAGSSSEAIRVFIAQGINTVPAEMRYPRTGEEAHLILKWVPIETVLDAIMSGAIKNVNAVAGVMAAHLVLTGQRQVRAVGD